MNNTWTQEQTDKSVKRQKRALYILVPLIAGLVTYLNALNDEFYVNNMQEVIEEFCQNVDYRNFYSSSLCGSGIIQIENQGEIYSFSCENEDTCLS